jgi:hypothetical protein
MLAQAEFVFHDEDPHGQTIANARW